MSNRIKIVVDKCKRFIYNSVVSRVVTGKAGYTDESLYRDSLV